MTVTIQFKRLLCSVDNSLRVLCFESTLEPQLIEMIRDETGWTLVHSSDGIATSYRQEANSPICSIKVRGVMDSPAMSLVTLISEIDLLPHFISLLPMQIDILKDESDFSKIVHAKVDLLWPISGRDVVIHGRGVDMLEHGRIAILMNSCESKAHPDIHIPDSSSGYVRCGLRPGGAIIRPLTANLTYIEFISNVDPKLAVIPDFLVNFFTRKLAHFGFSLFRTQVLAHTSVFMSTAHDPVYQFVHSRANYSRASHCISFRTLSRHSAVPQDPRLSIRRATIGKATSLRRR